MRILLSILILMLFAGCSVQSESVTETSKSAQDQFIISEPDQNESVADKTSENSKSIYDADFKNFTYLWTEKLGETGKTFTLKNGRFLEQEGRVLSLQSITYEDAKSDNEQDEALVTIRIDDGNSTYHILYIYEIENNKPKLIQSFEFGGLASVFGTAFVAHGELIIESYKHTGKGGECCPRIIERLHYGWKKDRFVLIETQEIENNYVERMKRNKK